ncbi:MAG TPA: hypothetical protein VMD27_02880 [Candidatus Aquilonibacter sp.]|nr:hypothetical protein [Candidatus Aquilonibacter sp.]
MHKKLPVIIAHLALLVFALPVPLLHEHLTNRAIETMRPVMKMSDGTFEPMLMPAPFLLLRWLGQLSWFVVCVVAVSFALSFWREQFSRFTTICVVAIGQCAFTSLYAFYAAFLLAELWLHPAA